MEGPPLGPGGEDITWPDQLAPWGRKASSTRKIKPQTSNLKLVEDWNEASDIRHLLKNVLPGHWKRRVEDEEKKRAKKRVAVRIISWRTPTPE